MMEFFSVYDLMLEGILVQRGLFLVRTLFSRPELFPSSAEKKAITRN